MIYLTTCFIPDQIMFQLNKVTANNITVAKLFHYIYSATCLKTWFSKWQL